jgi:hypothetical protein
MVEKGEYIIMRNETQRGNTGTTQAEQEKEIKTA